MSLSKTGELRREEMCAEVPAFTSGAPDADKVRMIRCHGKRGNQEWFLTQARSLFNFMFYV